MTLTRNVLVVGEMPDSIPAAGEVRIRIVASGINPGDIKKRENAFGYGMPYPRVIPHSDGAGRMDQLGAGVSPEWMGRSVWCYGAQSSRPFGTAAELTCVPVDQVAPLPESVAMEQGACLGIPGITAHRAVHAAGPVNGRTVLVQGAAGSVGLRVVQLARLAGARVIGTVRSPSDEATARSAGAHEVVPNDGQLVARIRALAPEGVDHIIDLGPISTPMSICLSSADRSRAIRPIMPLPRFPSGKWCSRISAPTFLAATTSLKKRKRKQLAI